jgi:SAM-dependent methyltransferase
MVSCSLPDENQLDHQVMLPLCDGCEGPMVEKFGEVLDPQTRETFSIVVCARCGLGQTFPQPDDLAKYYGTEYHGGRHGFTALHCVRRRLGFVRDVVGAGEGRRMLDVGCGDGTFLLAAQRAGWLVAGTEMYPSIARGEGLTVWSELKRAEERAPYACITLWHSLEHMRAPRAVVEEASRMLEPGGTMFIAVPNAEGLQASVFGPKWFHLDVPRHLFHFGSHALTTVVERAGLEVVRTFHLEMELDLFGWTQSALNSVFSEPNVFFYELTGRRPRIGTISKSVHFAAGTLLTALAIPLTAAGPLGSRGAILVMAARKPDRGVMSVTTKDA